MNNDLGNLRIVIVDDDPAIREMLRRAIDRQPGHEVVTEAGTAEEAMQVPKEEGYVFLVDVNMQGDGLALAKRIKRSFPRCGVVSISGLDHTLIGEALRHPAIDGFYAKSSPLTVLFNEIDRVAHRVS
ncbi:MAG: response regulator transcription factor [Actinomycetota bacterium]